MWKLDMTPCPGKSVYLKQVGLITYMAQIGCFVPADEAELGLCDFMFSRIQSCETASATCSSFTLDLCQLSLALKHATASSLVLLDEFGKGTRAADGVALLGATIEFLCRWKDGPKALVATHFTEIFRLGLVSETEPQLQVSHLRVLPQSDATASTIAYLYQLVPGCAEKSFGLECARKAGLDADVLQRAAEILATIEGSRAIPPPAGHAPGAADGRRVLCQAVVRQLCALDPEKENEAKAFLAFVAAQGREMNLCYAGGWCFDGAWYMLIFVMGVPGRVESHKRSAGHEMLVLLVQCMAQVIEDVDDSGALIIQIYSEYSGSCPFARKWFKYGLISRLRSQKSRNACHINNPALFSISIQ